MPKIERSVAYTFDAYSGGMKVDFLGEFFSMLISFELIFNLLFFLITPLKQNKLLAVDARVWRIKILL